jgi:zinc transport system ATP-binding protein
VAEKNDFLLSAQQLGVKIKDRWILEDIDFQIKSGEIVTLIGPNGAGKTTLVRALLGLIPITTGSLIRMPNLVIGYCPQRLTIEKTIPLTVRRFLSLGFSCALPQIIDALQKVGMDAFINASIHKLSGGEFQRVVLARALLRKPNLLVLDEPAQGVDVTGQIELYSLIAKLRHQLECGILMVSHDLHLVMAATDKVICLNHHICCMGHPEMVSQHPAYVELFGKPTLEALAVYTHHHNHAHDLSGNYHE